MNDTEGFHTHAQDVAATASTPAAKVILTDWKEIKQFGGASRRTRHLVLDAWGSSADGNFRHAGCFEAGN